VVPDRGAELVRHSKPSAGGSIGRKVRYPSRWSSVTSPFRCAWAKAMSQRETSSSVACRITTSLRSPDQRGFPSLSKVVRSALNHSSARRLSVCLLPELMTTVGRMAISIVCIIRSFLVSISESGSALPSPASAQPKPFSGSAGFCRCRNWLQASCSRASARGRFLESVCVPVMNLPPPPWAQCGAKRVIPAT
jgi:hypothetical protein